MYNAYMHTHKHTPLEIISNIAYVKILVEVRLNLVMLYCSVNVLLKLYCLEDCT